MQKQQLHSNFTHDEDEDRLIENRIGFIFSTFFIM